MRTTSHALVALLLCSFLFTCNDEGASQDAGSDRGALDLVKGPDGPARDLGGAPDNNVLPDLMINTDQRMPDKAHPSDGPLADKQFDLPLSKDTGSFDASYAFPKVLDGVWLVGWIGGINRFSWVKFQVTSPTSGKAWILDGKGLSGGTIPYWNCSGATSWNLTSKPNTVQLHMPSSTCNGYKSASYSFGGFKPHSGTYPKGAQLQAAVTAYPGSPTTIQGYRYASGWCDAAMTKCKDPFAP